MTRIRRAILSCYDKTGVVEVGRLLNEFRVEIVSTTGTLKVLREAGVPAISIADFTGVPELMNGRVKSLHPKVHAGLLGLRDSKLHVEQMEAHKLQWIDLVLVNLHPLEKIIEQPGISTEEVLEQVDIGGLAMIRSAAKNFRYVTVAVNPKRYSVLMHEMRALDGAISFATRYRMAQEAFACTADYDRRLADFLRQTEPPKE